MKVGEFLNSNRDSGDEAPQPEEEQSITSLTPSGIEVLYSWHPKRLYRVRNHFMLCDPEQTWQGEWVEVPSVTTVLGVLDKPALTWWGMKVGVEGVRTLAAQALGLDGFNGLGASYEEIGRWLVEHDVDGHVAQLTENKLTVNHQRDKAADRGVSVHSALEGWAVDPMFRPDPENYEEHERGYIRGLCAFLDDLGHVQNVEAEVMVGSLEHGFAGRYDLRISIYGPREMTTRVFPKRDPKVEAIPTGRYLLDLKTSKSVYETHALQLAAYEMASVECGYGSTDYRAVIHVTEDGRYEFVRTSAKPEDFLAVLRCYQAMQGGKGWLK